MYDISPSLPCTPQALACGVIERVIPMRNARTRSWFALSSLCLVLLGCNRAPEGTGSILVLVAASTRDAVQANAAKFTQETAIAVKINADDSSKLATQIVNDAPADIFLSANEKW